MAQFLSVEFTRPDASGGFVLSLDKLLAASALPIGLLLIGHIRVPPSLLLATGLVVAAYVAAHATTGGLTGPRPVSVYLFAGGALLGACSLYTALCALPDGFRVLSNAWIFFSLVTTLAAVPQALGIVPLWAAAGRDDLAHSVPGLVRATGFSSDPNYAALSLTLGLTFVLLSRRRHRVLLALLIYVGIAATFSRMGLIVGLIMFLVAPLLLALGHRSLRQFLPSLAKPLLALAACLVMFLLAAPATLRDFMADRLLDAGSAIAGLGSGPTTIRVGQTSGEGRQALIHAAQDIIADHPVFGIGAYNVPNAVAERTGAFLTIHNLFLELIVTGGLIGALVLVFVSWRILVAFRRGHLGADGEWALVVALTLSFALVGMTLSLTYNSVLWLPLTLALALESGRRVAQGLDPSPRPSRETIG